MTKGKKTVPETVSSSFGLPKTKYIYIFIKWAEVAVKCRLKLDTNQGPTMLKTLILSQEKTNHGY